MNNLIIITGHGGYASGIKSNLSFIAGDHPDLYAVDFLIDDTEETLRQKYEKIIENTNAQYVFICDLLGGTPFRCAAGLSQQIQGIEVICGVSSAALIEALFLKDSLSLEELAELLVKKSHESCVRFEFPTRKTSIDFSVTTDGI